MNPIENKNNINNDINNNNNIPQSETEENIKLEQLFNIYLTSFEIFKKTKRDPNNQKIKDYLQELKLLQNKEIKSFSHSQLLKYSLLLVSPLEKCSLECMEQILSSMEQILFNELLPKKILQKMVNKLIIYIPAFLRNNEIDYKINTKILHICEVIYGHQGLFIHNENLKIIIKIYLRIYLSMYNIDMYNAQTQSQKSLSVIIQKIVTQMKECNISNKIYLGYNENISSEINNEIDKKKKFLYKLQLNEFNFICGKYLDFLIDLIEIQNELNKNENENKNNENINIINEYIEIIKNIDYTSQDNDKYYSKIKSSLEKLNLSSLNIYYNNSNNKDNNNNSKLNKIGKYGWCILCRRSANYFSDLIYFPICNTKNCFCEKEFNICLSNIYPRNDFLNMLIYLSITSTVGTEDEYSNATKDMNFLCRQFCLENIREMFEKSNSIFKNDSDIIFIIKEIFKDSLVKNTLSSNIKIFQPSLELFISIIKVYRVHLKEQIEIFFMKVLITFLESENLEFVFKDAILKALLNIVNDCSFFVELYVNYDCDVNCSAVFRELINILTKIMNGLYHKSKYQNTLKPLQENELINKTLDFLNKFVFNLNALVEKNDKNDKKEKKHLINNIQDIKRSLSNKGIKLEKKLEKNNLNLNMKETENTFEENTTLFNSTNNIIDFKDKINKNLKIKKILEKAIEVFNIGKSSKECLNFLKEKHIIFLEDAFDIIKSAYINDLNSSNSFNISKVDYSKLLKPEQETILTSSEEINSYENFFKVNIFETPFISTMNPLIYFLLNEDKEKIPSIIYEDYTAFEMARFLRTNIKEILREKAGDFLCSGKPFNIKVLTYFIKSFEFSNINILEAMRKLFNELPLSGEAQVIDRIVQIFGEKFQRENPNDLKNPDHCYYLSFALLQLNTDLHRDEVKKKMTLDEFVARIYELIPGGNNNDSIDKKYLEILYNKILKDPLVVPGMKLSSMKNNKKELIKKERDNIMKTTFDKLTNINNSSNINYITDIDNDNIKHLIEFSWSNFFSIYCKILTESQNNDINNINTNNYLNNIHSCIENILLLARTCGILKLNIAEEAYLNTVLNMTNLIDNNREINLKNLESIKCFINFLINSGQYIKTGWYNILQVISKLNYFLETDINVIIQDIQHIYENKYKNNINNTNINKLFEKELNNVIAKKELLSKNISDMICEEVFTKTDKFDEETIINFVSDLCLISKQELTEYHTPRVFSLHKLVEVADFNIYRIQVEWVKIWKLISDHLVDVINKPIHENIWREALESLRQTICKLLQKKDLTVYNFQMDFFRPFEIIFSKTGEYVARGQAIINYIYYIVGSYGKMIHSGWVVIFRILKEGFQRKDEKINEDIKNTLEKIYEENIIINNNANIEVFRGYIECLCYMYLNKNNKQFAFETILNLLSKIMNNVDLQNKNNEDMINNNKNNIIKLSNINKKYDYLKIFFYGFDDLIPINVVEHLNLLFEIISHNKNIIFNEDWNSFLYLYFSYFKPHLILLLISKYYYRFNLFINDDNNKNELNQAFNEFNKENNTEAKISNAKIYLNNDIFNIIQEINQTNDINSDLYKKIFKKQNDNIIPFICFMKKIKELYNKEDMNKTIEKKLNDINDLDEKEYELAIDIFLEKFKYMLDKIPEKENFEINFDFFYEDLILITHKFIIINSNSDLLIKILNKILSKTEMNIISEQGLKKINQNNINILKILSRPKNEISEDELNKLIKFGNNFSSFLLNFSQNYPTEIKLEFKLISEIFFKTLEIDILNKYEKYKVINSSLTIDFLIKLQGIQTNIKTKIKKDEFNLLYNESIIKSIEIMHQIFIKYKLNNEDNSLLFSLLLFELENTIPQFFLLFKSDELNILFYALLDFVDAINPNLRKISHQLLHDFKKYNLIIFKGYEPNIKLEKEKDE